MRLDMHIILTCAEVERPDDDGEKDELMERLDSVRTGGGIAIESALSVGVAEESSLDRSFDDEGRSSSEGERKERSAMPYAFHDSIALH